MMENKDIEKRVRRIREKNSKTRDQFVEQIEISPQFLAEIENGTKGMSTETLYKICSRANASSDYILFGQQSTGEEKTPAVDLLSQIPPQYSEMLDDILQACLQTIQKAESSEK